MNSIVVYKSYTGHTEQYSKMLAEHLNCQAVKLKELSKVKLSDYSTIIYGGCVRAAKICGIKRMIANTNDLKDASVFIFAVGANGKTDENTKMLREKNLQANNVDYPLFYLQGGFEPEKLNLFLSLMLKRVAKSIEKRQAKDANALSKEDNEFLEFFKGSHNNVNESNLSELLLYLNETVE